MLPPSEIAKSAQEPPRYPLEQILGLGPEGRADLWFPHPDGLFVAASRVNQDRSPISLFFLPLFVFKGNDVQLLTAQLPPFEDWIEEPLVADPGLFVLTPRSLHYFPAHGYSEPFPHRHWDAAPGETFLAVVHDPTNDTTLLLIQGSGGLSLTRGNFQSEQWSERVRLDVPNLKPSYQMGLVPDQPTGIWIYDGEALTIAGLDGSARSARVESHFAVTRGAKPPERAPGRGRSGYFRPLMVRVPGPGLAFVYPQRVENAGIAVPALVGLGPGEAVGVQVKTAPGSWIIPDPRGDGFFCGDQDGFRRFQSRITPEWSDRRILAERSLAIGRRWMAGITERHDAGPLGSGPAQPDLVTFEIERSGGNCKIAPYRPAPLPIKGEVPRGMPPLQRGECLYVPIRQGTRSNVRTTVYQIRILTE